MTQIAEPVLIGDFTELTKEQENCVLPKPAPEWEARINKNIGTHSDCDAQRLFDAMKASKDDRGFRAGLEPFVDKAGAGHVWKLAECSPTRFPLQAHHIIPKNFLPTHIVCSFLAKNCDDNAVVKLKADTPYDTDHAYNGYCLPYATPLAEWEKAGSNSAKKDDVAKELMKVTKRQLHQGSHKRDQYTPESPAAEEEEDESVGHQEGSGYLGKIEQLLDLVSFSALEHVVFCKVCKPNNDARETNPRLSVVRHVDQVSGIVKVLMEANHIFVSERAYRAFQANKTDPERPDWLPAR